MYVNISAHAYVNYIYILKIMKCPNTIVPECFVCDTNLVFVISIYLVAGEFQCHLTEIECMPFTPHIDSIYYEAPIHNGAKF